ncbi:MAG: synaptic vesicle VAT-1 family membrane protein [Acidimicrobiales bacterium]
MRQVVIPRYGGPEVLTVREVDDPEPAPDEVRIRVAGAGVNFADISARAGLYPDAPSPPPMVVGYEVAGELDRVGKAVDGLAVGDRVIALTRFGGYSDVVTVPSSQVAKVHVGADLVEAAGIPVTFLTSYVMLNHLGSVRPGDTVLIHSAGGGVGLSALQLARNLGAVTIGTASAGKHERLRQHGLDHAIDYRTQDFEAEVLRITGGRGVDVALDAQGGTSFRKSYRCLAPMGRLFCFGLAAGNAPSRGQAWRTLPKALATTPVFHPLQLMGANKGVFGVNMGHLWGEQDRIGRFLGELAAMWERGDIAPVIDSTFPFDRAGQAHEQLGQARNFGKVVLTP